jgi:hypothetical protein
MRSAWTIFAKAALAAWALSGLHPGGASPLLAAPQNAGETSADDWRPNDDDSWLFDLRSGNLRIGDGIRGYQTPVGTCVDFADVIMALDLPIRLDKKLRRATGWVFDERRTILIDRDAGEVRLGSRIVRLSPAMVHDTPEGWCIATPALSDWLGVRLDPDLSNAILRLETTEKLPFQLQAERRNRAAALRPRESFDLASLPQAKAPYRMWGTPSIDVVASLAFTKDNGGDVTLQRRYELFASGEIAKATVEARLASDSHGVPESLRVRAYRSDPESQLLGPLKASHFALGDVSLLSTGLVAQGSVGRGAVVTNRPLERPDNFDSTSFRGDLPAGWDAELYRNGQLLALATPGPTGRYEFLDVPLLYGSNRFEIVLYGPQGQVRREIKQLQVGTESIPPRQTWYWAGIADEGRDLIGLRDGRLSRTGGWRGTIGVERGIDMRTSLAAYGHSLVIDDVRRNFGEVALRRAIGPTLLEVAGAYADQGGTALRAQWLAAFGQTYIRAEAVRGFDGFVSDRLKGDIDGNYSLSVDQSVRLGATVLPIHVDVRHITRTSGSNSLEASARASAGFQRMTLTGQIDWEQRKVPFGPDPPARVAASLLANARFGKVRLRGEARFGLSGPTDDSRFALVAEWNGKGDSQWRAELGYDRARDRFRGGAGYIRKFDKFQLSAFGEVASDGSVAASLGLAFSLGPDPRGGGIRVSSEKLASRGQVLATVWRDQNGDGIRQSGEPLEANVPLTAGLSVVDEATDATGAAIIDGLEPFRAVMIGIDAGSLPDPYIQPSLPGVVVTPRPGMTVRVMLPLVAAGEVEGTLARDGGNEIGGALIELVDSAGRVRASTVSEFDGFFLFESVAYGRYTLRISPDSAAALKIDSGQFAAVEVSGTHPRVRLGILAMRTRAPPSAPTMAAQGDGVTAAPRGPPVEVAAATAPDQDEKAEESGALLPGR